jgi:hypothetical protein
MSASKPMKEVKMNKARLFSLTVTLSMLAFSLEGFARGLGCFFGHPGSWFDGH